MHSKRNCREGTMRTAGLNLSPLTTRPGSLIGEAGNDIEWRLAA
jgi:hypothetical protein